MAKKSPTRNPSTTDEKRRSSAFAGGLAGADFITLLLQAQVPPLLNDEQLARLSAHLKAPVRLSTLADSRLRGQRSWLREIQLFNREMRKLRAQHAGLAAEAPPARPAASRRQGKKEWMVRALVLLAEHPEWNDARIAEQVGRHPATLSRNAEYERHATEIRRNSRRSTPAARSVGRQNLEPTDDSLDLTRAASRQSKAEEDTDARIDREHRARKK